MVTNYLNTVNGNEDNKDSIDLSNMTNYTAITVAQCTEGSFKYRFALSNEETQSAAVTGEPSEKKACPEIEIVIMFPEKENSSARKGTAVHELSSVKSPG